MRPAGIMTAGNAQYYTNIMGKMPGKKCLVLGSGDVGMIMARRLTLEGAKVLGVYEAQQTPGGLLRNVSQCLNDFDIPLYLEHTVLRAFGSQRLKAVEICRVDKNLGQIPGTASLVKCDTLILSVGLIPENELAETLDVPISENTRGPICDQNNMTMVDGVYSCGNAMHVNDMVDYVSESGEIAGRSAARYMSRERNLININASKDFLYVVPHSLDIDMLYGEAVIFFRSSAVRENVTVHVSVDNQKILSQQFLKLRPPEMERLAVDFGDFLTPDSEVELKMEAGS